MIYVLYEHDREGYLDFFGAFDGPPGLNIDELRDGFLAEFDHRKLGHQKFPEYKGPTRARPSLTGCYSGSIVMRNDPVPDPESKEYKAWTKECEKIRKAWDARREAKIAEQREKYPGKELKDMLLSFLQIEHGLKKLEAEFCSV